MKGWMLERYIQRVFLTLLLFGGPEKVQIKVTQIGIVRELWASFWPILQQLFKAEEDKLQYEQLISCFACFEIQENTNI
jgi:hypothetical protein